MAEWEAALAWLGGGKGPVGGGPHAAPHGGVLPKGPQGSPSRLPSPRRWESELRLFSAESWSVLTKLCLRRDGAQFPPPPRGQWGAGWQLCPPPFPPPHYLLYSLLSEPLSLALSVPSDGHWFTKGVTISLESCASCGFSHGISPVLWDRWGGAVSDGGPQPIVPHRCVGRWGDTVL